MNEITQHTFDYSTLPEAIAIEARGASERIRMRLRRTAEDIVETGRELAAMKEKLPHGQFLPWIEAEFEMSERTAHNFMAVSKRFKSATVADFSPKVLYALAAPSTPEAVVEKAIEKASAGEKVSSDDVKAWKQEAEAAISALNAATEEVLTLRGKIHDIQKNAADEIRVLKAAAEPKVIEREVIPADYDELKDRVAAAQDEALQYRRQVEALKKKQESEVSAKVEERIRFHEKELAAMESKRDIAERRLAELQENLEKIGRKSQTHEYHTSTINEWETKLISLAVDIQEFEYCELTEAKWRKLAAHFRDAANAIEATLNQHSMKEAAA